jgi:hypothetical protein
MTGGTGHYRNHDFRSGGAKNPTFFLKLKDPNQKKGFFYAKSITKYLDFKTKNKINALMQKILTPTDLHLNSAEYLRRFYHWLRLWYRALKVSQKQQNHG